MTTLGLGTAAVLLTMGCATGSDTPSPRDRDQVVVDPQGGFTDVLRIENESLVTTRVFEASPDRVWVALQEVYDELELQVDERRPAERRLGSPGFGVRRIAGERISRYVDCGQGVAGPKADEYAVRLRVYLTVEPHRRGAQLTTDVDATARPRDVSGSTIHCTSTARLEALIVAGIEERL